mmetsp:Transcript_142107/g.441905  ORF Transcript_142107/g.441905 Transcript_142107/m.441905 type:complete len:419 (+) Transcript_142107:76-1332(+)
MSQRMGPATPRSMKLGLVPERQASPPGSPAGAGQADARRCLSGVALASGRPPLAEGGAGPLLLHSLAQAAFLYEGVAYNLIFLRKVLPAAGKEDCVWPFFLLFNSFYGLALFSFYRAHCSDPGFIPDSWLEFTARVGTALPLAPARQEWQLGVATFCKRCSIARPERSHHCNACGRCVMRMDHHCPWINNCVGFMNHKFFLLLVVYAVVACVVAISTSLPELLRCLVALARRQADVFHRTPQPAVSEIVVFVVFGLLDFAFLALLTPMLSQHVQLAALNLTSVEGNYDSMDNPFDLGTTRRNLEQIFGRFGPDWFLPVTPARPLSDGITFPRNYEPLGPDGLPQGIVREYGQQRTTQEKLWRLRYQVRPTSSPQDPARGQEPSLQQLMDFTGCYAPCPVERDVDSVIMPPQRRPGWYA